MEVWGRLAVAVPSQARQNTLSASNDAGGYWVQPSWVLVYTGFKVNTDFLPFVFVPKWGEWLIND